MLPLVCFLFVLCNCELEKGEHRQSREFSRKMQALLLWCLQLKTTRLAFFNFPASCVIKEGEFLHPLWKVGT